MTARVEPLPCTVALTSREYDVLDLLANGWSNATIADLLVLSPRTVEAHVTRIFWKLGLADEDRQNRRVQATLAFHGLTDRRLTRCTG